MSYQNHKRAANNADGLETGFTVNNPIFNTDIQWITKDLRRLFKADPVLSLIATILLFIPLESEAVN